MRRCIFGRERFAGSFHLALVCGVRNGDVHAELLCGAVVEVIGRKGKQSTASRSEDHKFSSLALTSPSSPGWQKQLRPTYRYDKMPLCSPNANSPRFHRIADRNSRLAPQKVCDPAASTGPGVSCVSGRGLRGSGVSCALRATRGRRVEAEREGLVFSRGFLAQRRDRPWSILVGVGFWSCVGAKYKHP